MYSTTVLSTFHVVTPFFHRPEAGALSLLQIGGLQLLHAKCHASSVAKVVALGGFGLYTS